MPSSGFFSKEQIVAPEGFNRWRVPPASIAIHLCIGSVYAWSIFNPALVRIRGVVASSSQDWTLSQVVWVFTVAIVFLGLSAAIAGKWLERVGPRTVGIVAGLLWGGGMILGAVAIWLQQLWLLYLGYGVMGGCGLGLGYVSPVSTLIRWFPDRRGMAAGLAIMGFGGGAILATPIQELLMRRFSRAPTYLGSLDEVPLSTIDGRRYAEMASTIRNSAQSNQQKTAGGMAFKGMNSEADTRLAGTTRVEVVTLTPSEATQLGTDLSPGIYVVGTGSVGVAETFLVLGCFYLIVIVSASMLYRIPAPGWLPMGWEPRLPEVTRNFGGTYRSLKKKVDEFKREFQAVIGPRATNQASNSSLISTNHVDADQALKTPQFYLLWVMLCFNVTAGIGVLGVAKTMMTEIFGTALPSIVTSTFAATFVLMTSLFNMIGRFFWASVSDAIGRKNTYFIFFGAGALLYCMIPWIAWQVSESATWVWLAAFYAISMLIFTMYGGGFATIPAYLADLFGTRYVGAIHGRLLTAWSVAGVLGPVAITELRESSMRNAIAKLSGQIPAERFQSTFGASLSELPLLVKNKTVTIAKLLELAPPGTQDPTPTLYNSTMFLMAMLLVAALLANIAVKPVHPKHQIQS
ncbi:MAG: MFS transporter [Planctomycetes bacterium]|nr:MFS transporter [Planctomycetota bacterium]